MNWDGAFEPEMLTKMTTAFDQAWSRLKDGGYTGNEDEDRNALANHILSLVGGGETGIANLARVAAELFRRENGSF